MSQAPLDAGTFDRAKEALRRARHWGSDPVEELHNAGLLLTPARDKMIRLQAMNYLIRQLVSWRPAEILRRKFTPEHSSTPKDMYNCLVEFLEEHVSWWEREQ